MLRIFCPQKIMHSSLTNCECSIFLNLILLLQVRQLLKIRLPHNNSYDEMIIFKLFLFPY